MTNNEEIQTRDDAIITVNKIRTRILAGEQVPKEERAAAMKALRALRGQKTTTAKAKSTCTAPAEPIDMAKLFEEGPTQ